MQYAKNEVEKALRQMQGDFAAFMARQYAPPRDYPRHYEIARGDYFENGEYIVDAACFERLQGYLHSTKYAVDGGEYAKIEFESVSDYAAMHFLYYAMQYFATMIFDVEKGGEPLLEYFECDFMAQCFDFLKNEKHFADKKARLYLTLAHGFFDNLIESFSKFPLLKKGNAIFVLDALQGDKNV